VGLQLDPSRLEVLQSLVLEHVLAIDADEALRVLDDELQEEPLLRLDPRVDRALDRIERAGGVVGPFDVVELNLVAPARRRRALWPRSEDDTVGEIRHAADVEVQDEITIGLNRPQIPVPIAVENRAARLEARRTTRRLPLREVLRTAVEHFPRFLGGKLTDTDVPEANRVGERFESQ